LGCGGSRVDAALMTSSGFFLNHAQASAGHGNMLRWVLRTS
jgi:hypothetical protein